MNVSPIGPRPDAASLKITESAELVAKTKKAESTRLKVSFVALLVIGGAVTATILTGGAFAIGCGAVISLVALAVIVRNISKMKKEVHKIGDLIKNPPSKEKDPLLYAKKVFSDKAYNYTVSKNFSELNLSV